jgi:predicted transcriptional regulator
MLKDRESPKEDNTRTDILAAAVIAAGMYANPKSGDWTIEEIANDAVATLEEIKKHLSHE